MFTRFYISQFQCIVNPLRYVVTFFLLCGSPMLLKTSTRLPAAVIETMKHL